jgi:FK506-binding nuclear protein
MWNYIIIQLDKPEAKSQITKTATKPAPAVVSGEQKRNSEVLKSLLGTSISSSSNSSTVQGVIIEDTKPGSGPVAVVGNRVAVNYVGKLKSNGKVFDASKKKPFIFRLGRGEVIKGWDIGVAGMAVGGARRLTIPPEKAYGRQGSPPVIPPNAALVFDVTLCKIL